MFSGADCSGRADVVDEAFKSGSTGMELRGQKPNSRLGMADGWWLMFGVLVRLEKRWREGAMERQEARLLTGPLY